MVRGRGRSGARAAGSCPKAAGLASIAIVASYVPALRAATAGPVTAPRADWRQYPARLIRMRLDLFRARRARESRP